MATKLEKDLTRESTVTDEDGRNLLVTITANQTILIKAKGLRNVKEFTIEELWGKEPEDQDAPEPVEVKDIRRVLEDIRHTLAPKDIPYEAKVEFDSAVTNAMKSYTR